MTLSLLRPGISKRLWKVPDDPNTCLIKLRQLGEEPARQIAARNGVLTTTDEPRSDLLHRLNLDRAAPREVLDLFHQIRIAGKRAAHEHIGDHRDALTALKIARQLGIWFRRSFGKDPAFEPGPFQPPARPETAAAAVVEELERLRSERERFDLCFRFDGSDVGQGYPDALRKACYVL